MDQGIQHHDSADRDMGQLYCLYIYILKDNICIFMHHYINHHILLGAKLGDIVRYDYDLMTSLGVLYDEI